MLDYMLNVLWLSPYDYNPGWSLYLHSHPYYQLIYVVRGEGIFSYDSDQYVMNAGSNFLIRPNQKHSLRNTGGETLKTLDIKFFLFEQELIEQLDRMDSQLCIITKETELYWNRIRESSLRKPVFYKDEVRLSMALLLLHLIRADNSGRQETAQDPALDFLTNDNEIIQAFMDFIQQNYQKDLSLEDIAETLGYNKSYLCQLFRKYYNSTPMRFLYAFRVQAAKKLIQTSDYDLKQIAGMTGFNSIHHFTRLFGSTVGMSPGTYRDREKGTICQDINVDENFQNQLYVTRYTSQEDDETSKRG